MVAARPVTVRVSHQNNFDALRVLAALMVVHGHGWLLSGGTNPGLWGVPFSRVGLDIFFSISGFLVTGSWDREPRLKPFLVKRILRIFPGLILCVVSTILVVGTIATTLPIGRYFGAAGTWCYLANIALFAQLRLPGVFQDLREGGAVNGSLWSLLPEFLCYLTVPLFAALDRRSRVSALASAALLCGGASLYLLEVYQGAAFSVYHLDLGYTLAEVPFFFMGGLLRLVGQDAHQRLWRADLCLLFFTTNYMVSSWFDWWNLPIEWITLPYMVICFGRMSMPVLRRAARFGDLSFGLYLYAFPIQQLVIDRMPQNAYPVLTCLAITLPAAWLSWTFVESPALRLKPPTRAVRGSASAEQAIAKPTPAR